MKQSSLLLLLIGLCSFNSSDATGDFFPLPEEVTSDGSESDIECSNELCKHGGSCKLTPDPVNPCDCQDNFSGKFCETVRDTIPECKKTCLNGGSCKLGVDILEGGARTEFCDCPSAYFGSQCEKEAEKCGDDYCYHGSKCYEISISDGGSDYLCDCSSGYTEERYYSGKFCQYPSTVFCTGHDDPNGRQFCTNGGTCPEAPHEPCSCPPGFSGPRCAFAIDKDGSEYAECELDCQNGGTCQKGAKDLRQTFGKFANDVAHMLNETHENFEHCVCPEGFYGIRCEYQMEECGEEEHLCFHGSQCVGSGHELGCNCETSQLHTAGLFCEFFATDECEGVASTLPGDQHRGFCTNGGKCMEDEEGPNYCICPSEFEGPHCEYKNSNKDLLSISTASSGNARLMLLLCIFGATGTLIFLYYVRSRVDRPKDLRKDNALEKGYPDNTEADNGLSSFEIL